MGVDAVVEVVEVVEEAVEGDTEKVKTIESKSQG